MLGQALYIQAIHGGQATHATIAAHKIAVLLRGGMLPQASVYPAERRAPRDLLRRRRSLTRKRAELLGHGQNTKSQYNLPESRTTLADKANRQGVAERFPTPAVQKSLEVARALIDSYEHRLGDLEFHRVQAAQPHDAQPVYRLQTVPGLGKILSRVLLDESHDIARVPRGQDVVSYGRLGTCAKDSAGNRAGTAGTKSGKADRKWAFSEAAGLFRRDTPAGQQSLARLEKHHGQGKALTVLAHPLAQAVSSMVTRGGGSLWTRFSRANGGASEPAASRGHEGRSLMTGLCHHRPRASTNAQAHRGPVP